MDVVQTIGTMEVICCQFLFLQWVLSTDSN
jgi:hypothetical protein